MSDAPAQSGAAHYSARIAPSWSLDAWRAAARLALQAGIAPECMDWGDENASGLAWSADVSSAPMQLRQPPSVPQSFLSLAESVLCHRDPQRHALLYRLLWRITHGERHLLDTPTDADLHRAHAWAQAVRRDTHKMKAFVRFREVPGQPEHFIAWFEPAHHIVDRVAPFFARRFTGMHWAILTPERSVWWNRETLQFGPGALQSDAPAEDAGEALWQTYYANIFNPARLNPRMMTQEMPQRYWKHLPEAQLLPQLIRGAGERVQAMVEREAQAPRRRIPARASTPAAAAHARTPAMLDAPRTLEALRKRARDCRSCPLWEPATQTVFGEGPSDARVMLVGEQPGDREDLSGRPFVGPAGQLLDRALADAGIPRERLYLTNAVKHFRFERRGKVRLHRNPEVQHIEACRPWLEREIELVQPHVVVVLGATAARAVFGAGFARLRQRGQWMTLPNGMRAFATVHPSWVLRQPGEAREEAFRGLVDDLSLLRSDQALFDEGTAPQPRA